MLGWLSEHSNEKRPPLFHSSFLRLFQVLRTLGAAASATGVPSHGHNLLELLDILKVLDRTLDLPAVDSLGSLAGVLEADAKVRAPGAGRLRRGDVLRSVADLQECMLANCFLRKKSSEA